MTIKNMRAVMIVLLLLQAFTASAQASIPYGNNPANGNYISLNGVRHYYERYGSGAPLLLIHGNGTGIKGWAAQIAWFAKSYTVYAIDNRGRGKSDPGKDSLTFTQMSADLAEFIRQLALEDVCVVGKSDGGIVAILMGMNHPAHIKKIVAFSANMWPDSTALYATSVKENHRERIQAEKMLAAKDTSKNWYMERQRFRLDEFQPHISAKDLHKIKVPVLVMSSDRDLIREEHTFFIYKNIPNADLCILPGETHHVPKENPELFNAMVDKFLSQSYQGDSARFKN